MLTAVWRTLFACLVGCGCPSPGRPAQTSRACLWSRLKAEAIHRGVSRSTIQAAFADIRPEPKILDLENYQPEFKTPIWDYLASLVDDEA